MISAAWPVGVILGRKEQAKVEFALRSDNGLEVRLSFGCLYCCHPGLKAVDIPGLQRGLSAAWMRTAKMHQSSVGNGFWEDHEKIKYG